MGAGEGALRAALLIISAAGLTAGVGLWALDHHAWSVGIWTGAALVILVALVVQIAVSLHRGQFGLDIVAALSMSAALVFGEQFAAAVIALMYAGGQYLESFAVNRARREMTSLLADMPRTAVRLEDDDLVEVALEAVEPGDRLLVRRGDVVPVDGVVLSGVAVLDESALTGEAVPVRRVVGEPMMSGSVNVDEAFYLEASRRAAESAYAAIVRLVEAAQASRPPMARLADRFAMLFLCLTLLMAGAAWALTSDPVRAVAVLVVATPCPLILAVPVALVSGLSNAARHGILIKDGKALEQMAKVRCAVFDKTGTLTTGHVGLVGVRTMSAVSSTEILRLAASLEQASGHVVARAIVADARDRGLDLVAPTNVSESPGEGVRGMVGKCDVIVGSPSFVAARIAPAAGLESALADDSVAVAVNGELAGALVVADKLRPGAASLLDALRALGIGRIVLATGDHLDVARAVTAGLPIDRLHADLTPEQKIAVVLEERSRGPVMMVGDGVNDAPALAAADVGIAIGSSAASAAGDIIIIRNQIEGIQRVVTIARRSVAIALQSIVAGIGLSAAGMVAAAFGFLTPVQGALAQEAIDVAVVLNALRALR